MVSGQCFFFQPRAWLLRGKPWVYVSALLTALRGQRLWRVFMHRVQGLNMIQLLILSICGGRMVVPVHHAASLVSLIRKVRKVTVGKRYQETSVVFLICYNMEASNWVNAYRKFCFLTAFCNYCSL